MSTSDTWENGQLNLIFKNLAFAGLGDAGGLLPSAAAGVIEISLHVSDPGEAGTQATGETSYAGYTRSAKARSGVEWSVSGGIVTNINNIDFPTVTGGGPVTFTHVGIGTAHSGAGALMLSGALSAPKTVQNGDTPKILAGQLTVTIQ